jgi:VWFA-related protein
MKACYASIKVGFALWLLMGFAAVPAAAQQDGGSRPAIELTQVDTSHFPQVTVFVSVLDAQGKPVGVNPSQLRLSENGQLVPNNQVEAIGPVQALNTLLVFDVSGSMNKGDKLETARQAARAFIDQMRPGDRVGLLSFDTQVDYVQSLTDDRQALLAAVDSLHGIRDTAMYDALGQAVDILGQVSGRDAVLVLTDGMDNKSQLTLDDVLRRIAPTGLTISTVGLGDPGQLHVSMAGLDAPALQKLAGRTGGQYAYANDRRALSELYRGFSLAMHSEYAISYTSPSALRDGVARNISVSLLGAAPAQAEGAFNPGGLIPEVERPAPWWAFGLLLLGLIALLFLPALLRHRRRGGDWLAIDTPKPARIRFTGTQPGPR